MHKDPQFTSLSSKKYAKSPEKTVRSFTDEEVKKYTGINAFLKAKQKNTLLIGTEKTKPITQKIRAGFYVDWDPQAFYSLQSHISDMNMDS